jgi:hypothetical protein
LKGKNIQVLQKNERNGLEGIKEEKKDETTKKRSGV